MPSLKEKISQIFTDGIKFDSGGNAYPDRGEIESNLEKLFNEAFSAELDSILEKGHVGRSKMSADNYLRIVQKGKKYAVSEIKKALGK